MSADRLMIKRDVPFPLFDIDVLSATDEELKELSSELGLSLSLDEMKVIVDYFKKEGRNPTDIELQSLGQAWSEVLPKVDAGYNLPPPFLPFATDRVKRQAPPQASHPVRFWQAWYATSSGCNRSVW